MKIEKDFKLEISPEWRKIQTNKWQRPKWVKFTHRMVIDDPRWLRLSNDARAAWVSILLIASERDHYELPSPDILLRRLQSGGVVQKAGKFERIIRELNQGSFLKIISPELQSYRVSEIYTPYSGDLASPPPSEEQEKKRSGEEVKGGKAELYRIARQHFGGERAASVVAKAIDAGMPWAEVWERMAEQINAGAVGEADGLAHALSTAWS